MTFPDFSHEQKIWGLGYTYIIGVDEVGRGAFAGPVVAAAVVIKQNQQANLKDLGINDSKKVSPRRRLNLMRLIKRQTAYALGTVNIATINRVGIAKATTIAMRQAIARVLKKLYFDSTIVSRKYKSYPKSFLFVDAFYVKYVAGIGLKNQKAIVHGDEKSVAIAAASIVAKVHRDKFMMKLDRRYHTYNWGKNKGYGTREHREAIKLHGLTKHHRKKFTRNLLVQKESEFFPMLPNS